MTIAHRRWTHLGLATALLGTTALGACSQAGDADTPAETARANPDPTASTRSASHMSGPGMAPGEGGEIGEAGEGEHGEGGVDPASAARDPAQFAIAMAVIEAHVRAAMDAAAIGEAEAAGEMFAHPVSEILIDLEPVLPQYGVDPMEDLLLDASGAALDGAPADEIRARADDLILRLRAARASAAEAGDDPARQAVRVIADQIDRATAQYRAANGSGAYGPYLDGYGFYRTAQAVLAETEADLAADDADLVAAITEALAQLGTAYPSAGMPDRLAADPATLTAANSEVQLLLGN